MSRAPPDTLQSLTPRRPGKSGCPPSQHDGRGGASAPRVDDQDVCHGIVFTPLNPRPPPPSQADGQDSPGESSIRRARAFRRGFQPSGNSVGLDDLMDIGEPQTYLRSGREEWLEALLMISMGCRQPSSRTSRRAAPVLWSATAIRPFSPLPRRLFFRMLSIRPGQEVRVPSMTRSSSRHSGDTSTAARVMHLEPRQDRPDVIMIRTSRKTAGRSPQRRANPRCGVSSSGYPLRCRRQGCPLSDRPLLLQEIQGRLG